MGNLRKRFILTTPLVAGLLLAGCASRPAAIGASSVLSRCFVSDTTTAPPDTIYTIVPPVTGGPAVDCDGRPFALRDAPLVIPITVTPGADLRDVLEGRATPTQRPDVVVTQDPLLIDFARRSRGYLITPLTWSTTYVLTMAGAPDGALPDESERAALARDAVTGEARGAVEPFPWRTDSACARSPEAPPTTPAPVVAYSSGDAIARAIAERVVSLAGAPGYPLWLPRGLTRVGATLRVLPVAADSIAGVLASGRAAAAVITLARDPLGPCGMRDGDAMVPRGAIPLVDSRAHVIVRQGSGAAFIIGLGGTLHFVKRGIP